MNLTWTTWTPEDIAREAQRAIGVKTTLLEAFKSVPDAARTFENTIVALERAEQDVADAEQTFDLLVNVHPDAAIRDAALSAGTVIAEANVRLDFDRSIWNGVQAWLATGEIKRLEGANKKLADDMVRDLNRMGFGLPEDQFAELKASQVTLKKLEAAFEKAINDWSDAIEVTRDELVGMPESYIVGLKRTTGGNYRVTLEYPDLFPFMRQAVSDNARKELWTKYTRRGGQENMNRLAEMIRLRQRQAGLLGYTSHADFMIEIRMAKNKTTVEHFLLDILAKLQPALHVELKDLVKLKHDTLQLQHPKPIEFHEYSYWSYKLREQRYALDAEKLKEYFPLATVLQGMLDIYQELFGLKFRQLDEQLWHDDAKLFEATDASSSALIGHFVLDLHPRKNKYGHAVAMPVTLSPPALVVLVCNFPRTTLTQVEVETLFHEFGHVMHALVSSGQYQSQNGFGVGTDFVEAPSQMLEEWPWDARVIERISSHVQTGESLPREILQKMLAARHHMDANYYGDQAVQALYDITMHGQAVTTPVDSAGLAQLNRDLVLEYLSIDYPEGTITAAGWSHMADYDAGYYGYLWSKVYALDMFTAFESNPLDSSVGLRYRDCILAPGASRDEKQMVEEFLGRKPSNAAFLSALCI